MTHTERERQTQLIFNHFWVNLKNDYNDLANFWKLNFDICLPNKIKETTSILVTVTIQLKWTENKNNMT